jgi:hypothetical protein
MSTTTKASKASKVTKPISELVFDAFAPASSSAPTGPVGPRHTEPRRKGRGRQGAVRLGLLGLAALLGGAVALAGPALLGGSSTSDTTPTTLVAEESAAATAEAPAPVAAPVTPAAPQGQVAKPSTPAPVAPAVPVKVVGQGFTQLPPELDGDRKVAWATLLRNPSRDRVALDVQAHITFTGRGGAALKIEDETLDTILPGQTGAIAEETELAGVTGMRVQVLVGRWAEAKGFAGGLKASGVRTTRVAGQLTTTATLTSTLAQNLGDADAVAVYYNRAGRIIGGQSEGIDFIPARGSARVLMDTDTALPGIARTQVYANTQLFNIDD